MRLSVFYDHILQAAEQTGKPLADLLGKAGSAGIEAVEINLSYLCEHEETYHLLKNAGLQISCVYEFYEMEQKDEKDKAKKHIDTAMKAGAGRILVVPGFLSTKESEVMKECVQDYKKTADFLNKNEKALHMIQGLKDVVALGEQAGIMVTVEDFDDMTSPLSSINGMRWFMECIPQLKGTFDTGNFIMHKEDVLKAWEVLQNRIVHVHCKDRGKEPLAVGKGYIPMKAVINKIKESGYQGYLAIEHFDAKNQEACIEASAKYLREIVATV